MGIRFFCPNGHKLNVKAFLAGQTGICPYCGIKVDIPLKSTRGASRKDDAPQEANVAPAAAAAPASAAPLAAAPVSTTPAGIKSAPGQAVDSQPQAIPAAQPLADFAPVAPVAPVASPVFPAGPVAPMDTAAMGHGPPPPPPPPPPAAAPSAAPDPLAEAPDAVWYVRPSSGGQFGPAAPSVMRNWIHEGRVAADSLVWREGWRDWLEAGSVFPQLSGDAATPATNWAPPAAASVSPVVVAKKQRAKVEQQSRKSQMAIIATLIAAVIVLIAVFVWVALKTSSENEKGAAKPGPAAAGSAAPATAAPAPPSAEAPPKAAAPAAKSPTK